MNKISPLIHNVTLLKQYFSVHVAECVCLFVCRTELINTISKLNYKLEINCSSQKNKQTNVSKLKTHEKNRRRYSLSIGFRSDLKLKKINDEV